MTETCIDTQKLWDFSDKEEIWAKLVDFVNVIITAIDTDNTKRNTSKYFQEHIIKLHLFPPLLDDKSYLYRKLWCEAKHLIFVGIKHSRVGLLRIECDTSVNVDQDRIVLESHFNRNIGMTPNNEGRSPLCY